MIKWSFYGFLVSADMHVCSAHTRVQPLGGGGGEGLQGKNCHSVQRMGFHPGLIRAKAGGDCWPVEQN